MIEEKIVCSAIKITNVNEIYDDIYLGLRHNDCYRAIVDRRLLMEASDEWRIKCNQNALQGFLTTKNRFVDREEAMKIARVQGQVIAEFGNGTKLYSEGLY